jgi:hypothetical protein
MWYEIAHAPSLPCYSSSDTGRYTEGGRALPLPFPLNNRKLEDRFLDHGSTKPSRSR